MQIIRSWSFFFVLDLVMMHRMEMKSSLRSRGALSWRSWWTLTATVNLWISTQLLFCLMGVVSVLSRLQMRSYHISHSLLSLAFFRFSNWYHLLNHESYTFTSLIWKMEMRSMQCSIRPVVLQVEACICSDFSWSFMVFDNMLWHIINGQFSIRRWWHYY